MRVVIYKTDTPLRPRQKFMAFLVAEAPQNGNAVSSHSCLLPVRFCAETAPRCPRNRFGVLERRNRQETAKGSAVQDPGRAAEEMRMRGIINVVRAGLRSRPSCRTPDGP